MEMLVTYGEINVATFHTAGGDLFHYNLALYLAGDCATICRL